MSGGKARGVRARQALAGALRAQGRGGVRPGRGTGGAGQGMGGISPEAPDVQTGFTPQRSRAMITAGRTLLQIEGQKNAPAATPVTEEHRAALEAVTQGAAEAVLRENIPAEYHETIRRYFDDLARTRAKK